MSLSHDVVASSCRQDQHVASTSPWLTQAGSLAPMRKAARVAAGAGNLEALRKAVEALSEYRVELDDVCDEVSRTTAARRFAYGAFGNDSR